MNLLTIVKECVSWSKCNIEKSEICFIFIFALVRFTLNFAFGSPSTSPTYKRFTPTIPILQAKVLGSNYNISFSSISFFDMGFLSRPFTNHRTAGGGGRHLCNSPLPLPPSSKTLRH